MLEGIILGEEEYKISLYADDLLVTIGDPDSSLPLLMQTFEKYGEYSGYALNIDKTQIMTFNYTPTQEITRKYKFKWNSSQIKYLGVNLTTDLLQLFRINYTNNNGKIFNDLHSWALLPLDFGSRIRSVKMNILPRLLYTFLSLPIEIPHGQFREWNKHISRFIWDKKRPRVKFTTLCLPEEEGGMALPSLRDYYISAQLRPLVYWCSSTYVAKWKNIESSFIDMPIQSLLGHEGKRSSTTLIPNQFINFSLRVWREVIRRFQLAKEIRILRWPAYDPDFEPATLDHSLGTGLTMELHRCVRSLKREM